MIVSSSFKRSYQIRGPSHPCLAEDENKSCFRNEMAWRSTGRRKISRTLVKRLPALSSVTINFCVSYCRWYCAADFGRGVLRLWWPKLLLSKFDGCKSSFTSTINRQSHTMKYKLLLFTILKITVSKELHVSAHESHLQAYKYGTSKMKKVQLSAGLYLEISCMNQN